MDAKTLLQQVLNGIFLGSAYALIALGYTMVYGVLRLINFAHSDVYMFGAFMAYYLARNEWLLSSLGPGGPVVVVVGAMALAAGMGLLIERFAYRPGRSDSRFALAFWLGIVGAAAGQWAGRTPWTVALGAAIGIAVGLGGEAMGIRPARHDSKLTLLIIAIGVSLFLEYGGQQVFGVDPKTFPALLPSAPLNLPGLSVSSDQVIVLISAVTLMVLLNVVVHYTRMGKAMRAASFNLDAAKLMGVDTDKVIAFTFALGSALAAAGGVLVSLLYPRIDPLMGVMPGLKAFVAAVLGGIGNITGAMLGGLIVGIADIMVVALGKSTYRDAIAFVILVLILLIRPAGIMGKGRIEKV